MTDRQLPTASMGLTDEDRIKELELELSKVKEKLRMMKKIARLFKTLAEDIMKIDALSD